MALVKINYHMCRQQRKNIIKLKCREKEKLIAFIVIKGKGKENILR